MLRNFFLIICLTLFIAGCKLVALTIEFENGDVGFSGVTEESEDIE